MTLVWDDRIVAVEIDPTDGIFRRYCCYGRDLPATLTPIASMAIVADISANTAIAVAIRSQTVEGTYRSRVVSIRLCNGSSKDMSANV
jgi:hypothetical protein